MEAVADGWVNINIPGHLSIVCTGLLQLEVSGFGEQAVTG